MDYLLPIVLALTLQAFAESLLEPLAELPWLVASLAAVPYALGSFARRLYLRGSFRSSGWVSAAQGLAPPFLHVIAIVVLGWSSTVESWTGSRASLFEWPTPAGLLTFAPFVAYTLVAIDARARASASVEVAVSRVRRFQLRMFVAALAPLAIYAALAATVGASERARVTVEEVALVGAVFIGALLVALVALLPWVLRTSWETRPIEGGPLRDHLQAIARRARFRHRDLLMWRTGGLLANAAVVGVTPGQRVVFLSDGLIGALSLAEIGAVLAHEIGHVKRHHVLVFGAWIAAFLGAADWLLSGLESEALSMVVLLGLGVAWYLAFGWMSRRFELEADLYGIELCGDAQALIGALERVGGPHTRALSSWRHFSVARRVEFVQAVEREPRIGRDLVRKLRAATWIGVVLAVAIGAVELRRFVRALPQERVEVELRLGEYASAARLASGAQGIDPALARLVARADQLGAGRERFTADELEQEARRALERGELGDARDWIELARLRGARDLDPVAAALDALAADEPVDLGDLADPDWLAAIERHAATRPRE